MVYRKHHFMFAAILKSIKVKVHLWKYSQSKKHWCSTTSLCRWVYLTTPHIHLIWSDVQSSWLRVE